MTEPKDTPEPSIVERWLHEQQQWQRTLLTYLDSMTRNEEFLVHLGNAMRGSLLAGKPYPTVAPSAAGPGTPSPGAQADERIDQLLFAVHQLQGQMQDVLMALEDLGVRGRQQSPPLDAPSGPKKKRTSLAGKAANRPASRTRKAAQ